jgi:hypothetical protein
MKQAGSIQVFDCEEPVVFPAGWPELAAGTSPFGFKIDDKDGHAIWTDANEADFHKTLKQYGYTDREAANAVSQRTSASIDPGCVWDGKKCKSPCISPSHCKALLDIESRIFFCHCDL